MHDDACCEQTFHQTSEFRDDACCEQALQLFAFHPGCISGQGSQSIVGIAWKVVRIYEYSTSLMT